MRCAACGTEMLLVKVTPDHTMISSGYERYTLQCLGCFEIVEHLIFNSAKSSQTPSPPLGVLLDSGEPDGEHQRNGLAEGLKDQIAKIDSAKTTSL